jgi:hypothetical protein
MSVFTLLRKFIDVAFKIGVLLVVDVILCARVSMSAFWIFGSGRRLVNLPGPRGCCIADRNHTLDDHLSVQNIKCLVISPKEWYKGAMSWGVYVRNVLIPYFKFYFYSCFMV